MQSPVSDNHDDPIPDGCPEVAAKSANREVRRQQHGKGPRRWKSHAVTGGGGDRRKIGTRVLPARYVL